MKNNPTLTCSAAHHRQVEAMIQSSRFSRLDLILNVAESMKKTMSFHHLFLMNKNKNLNRWDSVDQGTSVSLQL
eukprot:scaffold3964_cov77-Skeletonema_marinoi.AAC.3